jgi:uncharacterized protein
MQVDSWVARRILDPSLLELIVLPTEACNFRCSYCYEDFSVGKMSRPIVDALKRLITSRADGCSRLILSWFGGEPLLASDIIIEVSEHAQTSFAKSHCDYQSHITTNASLLTIPVFKQLLSVGVRNYQITLDGPEELHNTTRVRRNGRGTFSVIWKNLLAINEFAESIAVPPFEISLRLHYDGMRIFSIGPLITDIERFLTARNNFTVAFHEIKRLGGARDSEIVLAFSDARTVARNYASRLGNAGFRTSMAYDLKECICYAARANSLIIRANGRLSKCTVALSNEWNDVGQLLPDGSVEVLNERLQPWLRGLFTGNPDDIKCPMVGLSKTPNGQARDR